MINYIFEFHSQFYFLHQLIHHLCLNKHINFFLGFLIQFVNKLCTITFHLFRHELITYCLYQGKFPYYLQTKKKRKSVKKKDCTY